MNYWLLIGWMSLVTALIYFLLSPNLLDTNEQVWYGGTVGLLIISALGFSLHLGRKHHLTHLQSFAIGIGLMLVYVLLFGFILWWVVAINMNHI